MEANLNFIGCQLLTGIVIYEWNGHVNDSSPLQPTFYAGINVSSHSVTTATDQSDCSPQNALVD